MKLEPAGNISSTVRSERSLNAMAKLAEAVRRCVTHEFHSPHCWRNTNRGLGANVKKENACSGTMVSSNKRVCLCDDPRRSYFEWIGTLVERSRERSVVDLASVFPVNSTMANNRYRCETENVGELVCEITEYEKVITQKGKEHF